MLERHELNMCSRSRPRIKCVWLSGQTQTHKSEPVNIDIISSRSGVGAAVLLKFLLDPGERVGERVLLQHCLKKSLRVRNGSSLWKWQCWQTFCQRASNHSPHSKDVYLKDFTFYTSTFEQSCCLSILRCKRLTTGKESSLHWFKYKNLYENESFRHWFLNNAQIG